MNNIYELTPKSVLCVGSAFAFIGFMSLISTLAKVFV